MPLFRFPTFKFPFETYKNPHHDRSWARALVWARTTGLVKGENARLRLERSCFSDLTALAYPLADEDRLTVAMSWMTWLFLFDDQLDECHLGHQVSEGGAVIASLVRLTQAMRTLNFAQPANPVEVAFCDLWALTAHTLSEHQQRRFLSNIRNYLVSLLWEIDFRVTRHVPTPLTFAEIRRNTGAVRPSFDLIEYVMHNEVPYDVHQSAEMDMLRNCAIDVICMSNDIFSFHKEHARGEVNNHVSMWHLYSGESTQQAVDRVHAFVGERVEMFSQTRARLDSLFEVFKLSHATQCIVQQYVDGMEHWMRANFEFSLRTPRYHDVEQSQPNQPISWLENITAMSHDAFVAPHTPGAAPAEVTTFSSAYRR